MIAASLLILCLIIFLPSITPPVAISIGISVLISGALLWTYSEFPVLVFSNLRRGFGLSTLSLNRYALRGERTAIIHGAVEVSPAEEFLGFMLLGAPGSAKTVRLLFGYLTPLLNRVKQEGGRRTSLIISDPKGTMVGLVERVIPFEKLYVLNPLYLDHPRFCQWAMGLELKLLKQITEFVARLFPEEKEKDSTSEFFSGWAKAIIVAVIYSLSLAFQAEAEAFVALGRAPYYLLRDIVLAFESLETVVVIITAHHPTPEKFRSFLKSKEGKAAYATAAQKIQSFSVPAALWSHAKISVRLGQILRQPSVFILGASPRNIALNAQLNGPLMDEFTAILLSKPERRHDPNGIETFVIDDESELTKMQQKHMGLNMGRSKAVTYISTALSIPGLKLTHPGESANAVLGLSQHHGYLGVDMESSAYLSEKLGDIDVVEEQVSFGTQYGKDGTTSSTTHSFQKTQRRLLSPQELNRTNPDYGTPGTSYGYFVAPGRGVHRSLDSIETLLKYSYQEAPSRFPMMDDNDPRQILTPWSAKERSLLKLSPLTSLKDTEPRLKAKTRSNASRQPQKKQQRQQNR
ncbi:MAG: type IV secretion system DNA-binding domain-containing protein [Cyanobacteria bacterium P01_D01_bin.105]